MNVCVARNLLLCQTGEIGLHGLLTSPSDFELIGVLKQSLGAGDEEIHTDINLSVMYPPYVCTEYCSTRSGTTYKR